MGFPVGYTELFVPKLLLHTLSLLGFIRKIISWLFRTLGLGDFLESDITWSESSYTSTSPVSELRRSVSAVLLREILPVMKFEDLDNKDSAQDSCAVCLYEFEDNEEIRSLTNCRHIFHRICLDRWMDHDQRTCPLCRTRFIPDEMQESFNERLWSAAGIPDYYN
ncbi:E3 ubiquitin-protein ligase rha1b-like [Thalictrum thalictroides]|uniref:E3 ubiquitin-protein ligase rha1b-like n=1 Tax=Thalictrum thalictroides TaxID=46969 RepID=A0A7J6W9E2_THATH|nr:E3 ubiquitin-protein ligase rha1b-like [Thalictrum thalictroides]